ncbi:MAG: hypothetical protein K6F63_05165 [Lachnospiraceae bacterium]|nr:hypothetical protein [Lachnospiraceae bacterium]
MKTIQGVELAIKVLTVIAVIASVINVLKSLFTAFSDPVGVWISLIILGVNCFLTFKIYYNIAGLEECSTLIKVLVFIFMTFAVGVLVCCYHPEDYVRYNGNMNRGYGDGETRGGSGGDEPKNPNFLSGIEPIHRHSDEE